MRRRRIVLDTDIGTDADDAIALALALASPEIELVAVTHVSGDTHRRAQISRRLLDLAGRSAVPVHAGCGRPQTPGTEFAWFGHEGKGIIDRNLPVADEHAVAALIRLFRDDPDLELVAIGPLTNVAAALTEAPDLTRRIKRLTVMGGYVRRVVCGGGVLSPLVDYNLRVDPEASRIVLTSAVPLLLVPTDVTVQVWLAESQLRRLELSRSELLQCIARNVRHWAPLQQRIFTHLGAQMRADNVAFLHDPLALACAFDETFCTVEELSIDLVADGSLFRTVERPRPTATTHRLRIATGVDAARFRSFLFERLRQLA